MIEFTLDNIFKKLDIAVLEEISPVFYPKAYDVERSFEEHSGRLSKKQAIDYLYRFVFGFDPFAVTSIEMLISLMVDIFLFDNKMPDIITDHKVNQYTIMIPDGVDFRSWFGSQNSFLGWLRSECDKYLKNKLDLGEPGSIDFYHSILKIKSIQLMSQSILSKIELPNDKTQILEKLPKEDSWLLLGISEKKVTRILPRTMATFFHTLRILGYIGTHDTKQLELSQAEIETILGLVTRVLKWYQERKKQS